ncbi:MAG: multiple monosaccharide ABC transporter permease [Lachnospiraceae bacterium]|nr:multiple monosaccharide ABC transporter permease [Lachnospiraceae bacterium]
MLKAKEILKKYTMVFVLILVIIMFTIGTGGKILLPANINNLIAQNAYVFVLATGMLLCILTGGNIDLSVGSVVCFVGAIGGTLMSQKNVSIPVAILVMIVVGIGIGIWQGFWIAYVKIPPFIVTLAGMLVFRGLSNVILNGLTISPMPDKYLAIFNSYVPDFFGGTNMNITCMLAGVLACVIFIALQIKNRRNRAKNGYELERLSGVIVKTSVICVAVLAFMYKLSLHKGIPYVLLWVVVIILIYSYITSKTTTGRYFYAVGGNEKATKLSGINTNKVYFLAYLNMAFLAAVAGMITIARLNSANPTAGTNYEMDAIGSCFIGGASAYGGIGTVPGVIVGAILMGVINLGMNIMGVDANYQKVVKGLVLLAAVIFDVVSKKKQS